MNIFEEFFSTMKKNRDIFDKYAVDTNLGISTDLVFENNMKNTGKELIANTNEIDRILEIRSVEFFNIINLALNQYTYSEWLACLEEKILLEYTVPIFSRVLKKEPLLYGYNNAGQVLYKIMTLDENFWIEHKEWKNFFENIIKDLFQEMSQERLKELLSKEIFDELQAIFLSNNIS